MNFEINDEKMEEIIEKHFIEKKKRIHQQMTTAEQCVKSGLFSRIQDFMHEHDVQMENEELAYGTPSLKARFQPFTYEELIAFYETINYLLHHESTLPVDIIVLEEDDCSGEYIVGRVSVSMACGQGTSVVVKPNKPNIAND